MCNENLCRECEHFEQCEIMIILHLPISKHIKYYDFEETVGEVVASLHEEYKIKRGDKIAQIMLCEHKSYLFGIDTEDERTGGFGSTGC